MNPENIRKLQKLFRIPLFLPSAVYGGVVRARGLLYDKHLLKTHKFSAIKIIGVGNIAAGGTGKTPIVIKLAQTLSKKGKVCVVTGSYPTKNKGVSVVSLEGNIFKKPPVVPDEAYLIAKKTDVTVISSKSRRAAIELAIGLNMRYVVLDDALHKRNIEKDFEICVVDKNRPFEDGFYLPAGALRDAKSSLKRCDFIFCVDKKIEAGKRKQLMDCYDTHFEPKGLFDKQGKKVEGIKSVFAFCGIGKPKAFLESLKEYGMDVKGYNFFEDHRIYTKKDIEKLHRLKKEKNAEILVTTYKDFVKIETEDVYYLDIEPVIDRFDEIVERII